MSEVTLYCQDLPALHVGPSRKSSPSKGGGYCHDKPVGTVLGLLANKDAHRRTGVPRPRENTHPSRTPLGPYRWAVQGYLAHKKHPPP